MLCFRMESDMATFQTQMAMLMRHNHAPQKVKETKRFGFEQFTSPLSPQSPGQYQFCCWDLEMLQVAPRYHSATVTSRIVLSIQQILCSLQVLLWNHHPMSIPSCCGNTIPSPCDTTKWPEPTEAA